MRVSFFSHVWRVLLIAAVSAAVVAGIRSVDSKRQYANQTALALRWTRQMVAQTESLALAADARGEREPLAWAARLLSQGTDSRIIYASKVEVPLPVTEPESYSLDPSTGIFDYSKILDMQGGNGVRIRLYTSRTGIFGARSLLQHDITVGALFLLIYGLLFFWFGRVRKVAAPAPVAPPQTPPTPPELNLIRALIGEWVVEAKRSLTDLGIHIREMVRAATQLSTASREVKDLLYSLRLKAHGQLEILHTETKKAGDLTALAAEVEALLTRKPAPDAATQRLLKKLLATAIRSAEAVAEAEMQFEPLATDADLAFESLEAMTRATEAISAEIKATTQGMIAQSQKIGDLKKRGGE